jgi:hypothetical protein
LVYLRWKLKFREEENVAAGAAAGLLCAHQWFQVKCANMPEKYKFDDNPFKAFDDIPFKAFDDIPFKAFDDIPFQCDNRQGWHFKLTQIRILPFLFRNLWLSLCLVVYRGCTVHTAASAS